MNLMPDKIQAMSTRLFPKNRGALGYVVDGIAARCDWVVLSDRQSPTVALVKRGGSDSPRHVFLSLRAPFEALAFFLDEVLPLISAPFVLISGSEDVTIPNQLDRRWRGFTVGETARIHALLNDPRVMHWFAENLDDRAHPKLSPLPLGMIFPESVKDHKISIPAVQPLHARPLLALCAHRVRDGAQWDMRRHVTKLCRQYFSDFCTVVEDELPEEVFLELVGQHAFVICVQGGGVDPSPKAWQSIAHGAIPIMRSSALDEAYTRLPVAIVPRWDSTCLSVALLEQWQLQHAPSHDIPENRSVVLQRLGINDWWSLICSRLEDLQVVRAAVTAVPSRHHA